MRSQGPYDGVFWPQKPVESDSQCAFCGIDGIIESAVHPCQSWQLVSREEVMESLKGFSQGLFMGVHHL